uniref:Uncharacterized protein n=1 Tax=Vitis vinifera TaxID=29760 RepID=F6GY34_VITVI
MLRVRDSSTALTWKWTPVNTTKANSLQLVYILS